uniref:Uncharacterized protein n=1 Tax=Sphaerodactylus townsendi TaxID=933632 RepID=A0ACB8EAM1_9SAUR
MSEWRVQRVGRCVVRRTGNALPVAKEALHVWKAQCSSFENQSLTTRYPQLCILEGGEKSSLKSRKTIKTGPYRLCRLIDRLESKQTRSERQCRHREGIWPVIATKRQRTEWL